MALPFWFNCRLPIDSASRTRTLSNRSSAQRAGESHDCSNSMLISRLHSNFSQRRNLTFQWQPLSLNALIYFVIANTLFAKTRTHSPSRPYFQAMWASNFNSPHTLPLSVEMPLWATDWLMRILTGYLRSHPATCFAWRKLASSCVGTSRWIHVSLNWTLVLDGSCGSTESSSRRGLFFKVLIGSCVIYLFLLCLLLWKLRW